MTPTAVAVELYREDQDVQEAEAAARTVADEAVQAINIHREMRRQGREAVAR